jgi:hypothetical protein
VKRCKRKIDLFDVDISHFKSAYVTIRKWLKKYKELKDLDLNIDRDKNPQVL